MSETGKRLTINDVETKVFRRVASGYEPREVDAYLDCICDELELLQNEIATLKHQLDFARAEVRKAEAASGFVTPAAPAAPAAAADGSYRDVLEMAQRVKDMTIADAQKKAEEIVAEAQTQADAVLGGLDEQRAKLEETIGTLKNSASAYRERFAAMIAEHKALLDQLAVDD